MRTGKILNNKRNVCTIILNKSTTNLLLNKSTTKSEKIYLNTTTLTNRGAGLRFPRPLPALRFMAGLTRVATPSNNSFRLSNKKSDFLNFRPSTERKLFASRRLYISIRRWPLSFSATCTIRNWSINIK